MPIKTYTWEEKYEKYIYQTNAWENKGYNVEVLTKTQFKNEYNKEQYIAEKKGDTKASIIRKLASQSRIYRKSDLGKFVDFFEEKKGEKLTRQEVWENINKMSTVELFNAILEMNGKNYDTSGVMYNDMTGQHNTQYALDKARRSQR